MKLHALKYLLAVAMLAGATACESTQRSDSTSQRTGVTSDADDYAKTHPRAASETPAEPAAETRTTRRWPTRASGAEGRVWSSMAYPTGIASTSVVGIEKGMPAQVNLDQTFEYHLIVTNLTANDLDNVSVTETFGPNFEYQGSNPSAQNDSDDTVVWSLGSMAPNESRTIVIRGRGTSVGNISSCVAVAYASVLCAGTSVVAPDLAISLAGPAEVLRCDPIVYTVQVSNPGTGAVQNVRVRQPLPDGLTHNGQRFAEFTIDALAPNQTRQFNITVEANKAGRFETVANARSGELEAESATVRTIVRQPVLTIERTCPELRYLGREIDVTITVKNTGDGVARDLVIEEAVPSGAQVVRTSQGGQVGGGKVTWTFPSLAPDAERTVTLTYNAANIGTYRATASARAYCAEVVSDDCMTRVEGIPALLLEGFDDPDPVEIGNTTTYTLIVTNQGSADLTNVRLVCTMDEGDTMQFVSASGTTPAGAVTGNARAREITFPALQRLAPGQRATYTVTVRAAKEGQVSFRAEAVSNEITRPLIKVETTNFYR